MAVSGAAKLWLPLASVQLEVQLTNRPHEYLSRVIFLAITVGPRLRKWDAG